MEAIQLEHTDLILAVHNHDECMGPKCCVHNRSNHSMRPFPQNWRADRQLMERICPHGIGHPDPDDPKIYMTSTEGENYELIHGCDGCCEGAYNFL